jgi:hypothetical protein
MGEHHVRSSATAGRIAGRSALTAATAIALTGGTASFAFAAQVPSVDHTAQATQTAVGSLAAGAAALPSTPAPTSAAGFEKLLGDHEADVEHKVADIAGPAAEDTQRALNANGVPAGNRVTDTEHEIVNRSGAVSEQVHHATGSAAASLDARSAPTAAQARHASQSAAAQARHAAAEAQHEASGAAAEAQHETSTAAAGASSALPSVLSFA